MPRIDLSSTPARIAAALVVVSSFLVSPLTAGLRGTKAAGGAGQKTGPASKRPTPRAGGGGDAPPFTDRKTAAKPLAEFVPGEALVRFRSEAKAAGVEASGARLAIGGDGGGTSVQISRFEGSEIVPGLRLARFEAGDTLEAVAALAGRADVLYAEPNYVWRALAVPNDPRFASGEMYGLHKIGAPAAWDTTQGSASVVVAVIDEGIDLSHPDLAANAWTNPGETPGNGLDDDGNGFIDDVNGWDFHHDDGTIYDGPTDDHGTHVAGTIGARGDNGAGVTGVNWRVSLMSVKVLGPGGGFTSNIIRGYNYVRQMRQRGTNVRVTNNSYGGPGRSQAALDAINALNAEGVLFVAAAGNDARDNFGYPTYPASYNAPNLLAVASTNSSDALSSFSNFSSRTVGTGAPGSGVLSTTPANTYSSYSGTSMAAPHVAGAAALLLSAAPNISVANLRGALAFTGDRVTALQNNTTTGRRLNARAALDAALEADSAAPAQTALAVQSQSGRSLTLSFAAPGDDGFAGTASDYDFFFVNPSTGLRLLLPSNDTPAAGGTQQQATLNLPYRNLSGTVELVAYDNRGNAGVSSLAVAVQQTEQSDPFAVQTSAPEPLSAGGAALALAGDDKYLANHALPFQFPFYGQQRTQVTVSTNGALYFSNPPRQPNGDAYDADGAVGAMQGHTMIAGLWDDLEIDAGRRADAGVFVSQPDPSRVIYRWQATTYPTSHGVSRGVNAVNFEIELRSDGTVLTRYGGGNVNVVPVVGVSGGEPSAYDVASHTSENAFRNLTAAQTVTFTPRAAQTGPQGCVSTPINLGETLAGTLAAGDCQHPGNGSFYDGYTFTGTAGQLVTVRMLSPAPGQSGGFDTYLYLLRPGETTPGPGSIQNDDGEGSGSTDTLDSAIVAVLPETGTYTILANSAQPNQTGSYSVQLGGGCAALPAVANAPADGALAATDCRLPNGLFADAYSFDAVAGQRIAVEMRSSAVDSFLFLLSADGFTELARDDDGFDTGNPSNLDARIPQNPGLVTLPTAGTYYVLASSFNPGETGAYRLTVFTPELSVGMTSSPASAAVGGDITYDIVVTNGGPPSAGVTLTDTLPAGVQLVSASPGQGSCSGTTTVTCDLGGLAAGATATVRIVVRTLTAGTKLNSVSVAGLEAERDTSNNTAQQATEVSASVSGRVLDAGTNAPVGGVTLTLSGSQSGATQTDAAGNYSFAGLAAGGTYTVTPSLAGYTFAPSSRTFASLSANQTADFAGTPPTFTISGRVVNASNAGLGGVAVTLSGSQSAATQTDQAGDYSFTNLPAGGSYTVTPALANFSFAPPSRSFPNLQANQTGDFTAARNAYTISGRVADAANNPVAGVAVALSGAQSAAAQTDAQGNYSFVNLPAGDSYTVTPSLANHTFAPPSRPFNNLAANQTGDFVVTLNTFAVSGRVADAANAPLANVTITLSGSASAAAQTDNAGTYSFANLAAGGTYTVTPSKANFTFAPASRTFANLISDQAAGFTANVCSYVVSGDSQQFGAAGGQGAATMTAPEGCAWTAKSLASWLTITSGASGTGGGTINFTVAANAGPARVGAILHTDDSFYNVAQSSGCAYSIAPSAQTVTAAGGTLPVAVTASSSECAWAAASSSDFVSVASGASGAGNGTVTLTVLANAGHAARSGTATIAGQTFTVTQPPAPPAVLFSSATFRAGEGDARAVVSVTRAGDLSAAASVVVETVDDPAAVPCDPTARRPDGTEYPRGAAYARCDYATTIETINFAAGDAAPRSVAVPLIDDGHAEGAETVQLRLVSAAGAALGAQSAATLTIDDNDGAGAPNPISGNAFFVRQQYLDFLSREPEEGEPWTGVLARCPDVFNINPNAPSAACDRILVSGAFFQSPEFQLKGLYAYFLYRVAFDRRPDYSEIVRDMRGVTGQTPEEVFAKRAQLAASFTQRDEFKSIYGGLNNRQYVEALLGRRGLGRITTEDPLLPDGTAQVTLTAQQLADALDAGSLTRAQVLRAVVQSSEVDAAEYPGAFVAMQYYGYLRRTPEQSGYDAWLRVITENPDDVRVMINGFVNSTEYRLRFGPQ